MSNCRQARKFTFSAKGKQQRQIWKMKTIEHKKRMVNSIGWWGLQLSSVPSPPFHIPWQWRFSTLNKDAIIEGCSFSRLIWSHETDSRVKCVVKSGIRNKKQFFVSISALMTDLRARFPGDPLISLLLAVCFLNISVHKHLFSRHKTLLQVLECPKLHVQITRCFKVELAHYPLNDFVFTYCIETLDSRLPISVK